MSCLSNDVLIVSPSGRETQKIHALTLANGPILFNDDGLQLDIGLMYDIIKPNDPDLGPYKVRTRAYDYAIRDADDRTRVSWHWHPLGESTYRDPHFHVPGDWPGIHFGSGRTSLETVVRTCIREMGAEPHRDDWADILDVNEGRFVLYRTWGHRMELAKAAE